MFNGRFSTVAVDGGAGNNDNGSEWGLHGSLRDLPNPPRRVQLGDDLHFPQTPRLFRFRLATLVHVNLTTLSPFSQRISHFLSSLLLIYYSIDEFEKCCRERWHQRLPLSGTVTGARELYLTRRTALQQFKFLDPFAFDFFAYKPFNHLLLHQNRIFFTQVRYLFYITTTVV